jgi:hypothetical protein
VGTVKTTEAIEGMPMSAIRSVWDVKGAEPPVTRFTISNGDVVYFAIPWTAEEKDLQLCEELFALQIESIRKYRQEISNREEWWIKNRHLGP